MDEAEEEEAAAPAVRQVSRRRLAMIVAPIVVLVVAANVGNALAPTLIVKHPLLLLMLESRNRSLLLVSNKVDTVPFILVGVIRRMLADPLFYVLGYLYGDRAVRWMEREVGDTGEWIERFFAKAAYPLVFFFPGLAVCVLAGATRMKPLVFGVLNFVGTVTVVVALRLTGKAFSGPLDSVNRWLAHNYKWLTIVSIALTILWLWDRRRRGRAEVPSFEELQTEESVEADGEAGPLGHGLDRE